MRVSRLVVRLWKLAPGIAAICVLLLGAGEALAFVRVPITCRPDIQYDKTPGLYLLNSATCPKVVCVEEGGGEEFRCQDVVIFGGPNDGASGCACPAAEMNHTCILVFQHTGVYHPPTPPNREIVMPACENLGCDGPCTMTSYGNGTVYCASCSD